VELKLDRLRQVALPARSLERSIAFYRDTLGAEFIAEYGTLAFFNLDGTRLLLEQSPEVRPSDAVLYFVVSDINQAHAILQNRGVTFDSAPHLIHTDESGTFGPAGEEEWMAFFKDPDGNTLALSARRRSSAS